MGLEVEPLLGLHVGKVVIILAFRLCFEMRMRDNVGVSKFKKGTV